MGTDITLFVEVLDPITGKWESPEEWVYDEGCAWWEVPYEKRLYHNRNYRLFAMLVGERNYQEIVPFSEPRGLPNDTDHRIRDYLDEDSYRCSYFTTKELLSFDWTAPMKTEAYVGLATWFSWKSSLEYDHKAEPDGWCGGTNGTILTEDEAKQIISQRETISPLYQDTIEWLMKEHWRTYVKCEWSRPRHLYAVDFWGEVIPHMLGLGAPENVRIVFGFG